MNSSHVKKRLVYQNGKSLASQIQSTLTAANNSPDKKKDGEVDVMRGEPMSLGENFFNKQLVEMILRAVSHGYMLKIPGIGMEGPSLLEI